MKSARRIAVSLSVSLTLLFPVATAQKRSVGSSSSSSSSGNASKLIAVKVKGTTRYTDKEILAASGLKLGQSAAEGDFKEAVRILGDSGLFSGVAHSFYSSAAGIRLELQITDVQSDRLLPARFENFVWFTDDELQTALQPLVPLFKRELPISGNIPDHVSEALQAILTEHHLPGRVSYLREGQVESGAPFTAFTYRVDEVRIRIQGIEFPGASREFTPLLTSAAHSLIGREYFRPATAAVAKLDLLPVYLQRGYLKAGFAPSNARILPESNASPEEAAADAETTPVLQVDAIIPVNPGKLYLTSGVDWKGNAAIPAKDLATLLHLPAGDPADAVRLLRDIENVEKLYRSRGYMAVQVKPEAQFDEEKSTVRYQISVAEGDRYRMGDLEITGLDTQTTNRLLAEWTLKEGQPYNADYPAKFQESIGKLLPKQSRWAITIHETPDARDKTVDVEVRFKQQ